jgi:hypothetical protein
MRRTNPIIGLIAVLAMVAAAAAGRRRRHDDHRREARRRQQRPRSRRLRPRRPTPAVTPPHRPDDGGDNPLAEYGEDPSAADMALVEGAGTGQPSDEDSWNIILASVARAIRTSTRPPSTRRWSAGRTRSATPAAVASSRHGLRRRRRQRRQRVAFGEPHGGHPPGPHLSRDRHDRLHGGQLRPGPGGARERHPVPDPERSRLHRRIPGHGGAAGAGDPGAEAAGIPYISFSAGYVGLPGQEGALTPGEDYTSVVGEDLCALGESFAEVLNEGVGEGKVAMLGGSPGNALSLGWQRVHQPALGRGDRTGQPTGRREQHHR